MTIERFADEVSSNSPAPGGGSVAALAGSLGAALAAMVANLTVGKKGYEAAWKSSSSLAERAQALKAALLVAVDDDTKAFDDVLAAMRLPKLTEEQQRTREAAISAAYEKATAVPLATARLCLQALELAERSRRLRKPEFGLGCRRRRAAREGWARRRRPERSHQPAIGARRRVQDRDARRNPGTAVQIREQTRQDARRGRSESQALVAVNTPAWRARVAGGTPFARSEDRTFARSGVPLRLALAS